MLTADEQEAILRKFSLMQRNEYKRRKKLERGEMSKQSYEESIIREKRELKEMLKEAG